MLTPKNYMSVKKTVYISESNNTALKELKETYGFSSESDAVNYLIANAQEHPEKKNCTGGQKGIGRKLSGKGPDQVGYPDSGTEYNYNSGCN